MSDASTGTGMLECVLCRKAPRSCWRWTPTGRILSRLSHTTWSRIRTRRPLPVRSRLSIDAKSCAKPVQKKTKALARSIGKPVLECFLAFYRLVVKNVSCLFAAHFGFPLAAHTALQQFIEGKKVIAAYTADARVDKVCQALSAGKFALVGAQHVGEPSLLFLEKTILFHASLGGPWERVHACLD